MRLIWIGFVLLLSSLVARDPDQVLQIPMRDGAKLPTDLYLPTPESKNLPIILVRTPSDKRAHYKAYIPLTEYGYAVAIQDARSYLDKEGKTFPWVADGWGELQDGYDTVMWLAKSPYSNGKIGTLGFSAMGISQLLLAPTNPAPLKAQYIGFAASSMYNHAMFMGGVLRKSQVEGWLGYYAKDPVIMGAVLAQGEEGDLWSRMECTKQAENVQVPALHYGGWFDTFSQGTIDAFVTLQENGGKGARGKQILLMGPWTHHYPRTTKLGDFDVPENGKQPPVDMGPKAWFDYYLKGEKNGIEQLPAVTYYVMGPLDGTPSKGNVWKTADTWPVPSEKVNFYLGKKYSLSTRASEAGHVLYDYKIQNPVPTIGGRNLFIEAGPKDQREIEKRDDVLVFTSAPLEDDLEVTGRLSAKIFVATNRKDGIISIRLTDVYPDGRSMLVADGIKKISCEPGSICEAEVDLWSHSQVFAKGHRIQVSVSGGNYPQFEDHHEGDSDYLLYFGGETPSSVILPVIR